MPFPFVWGIPQDVEKEALLVLRQSIVDVVASKVGCPQSWVRPFFPKDLLPDPVEPTDGATTIYIRLDTAMFHDMKQPEEKVGEVLQAVAQVVWDAFEGEYEVEAFIGDLNPKWKILLDPKYKE